VRGEEPCSRATLTFPTNPHLFFIGFQFYEHAACTTYSSSQGKQLPNSFGLTGLAPVAWHNLRLSLCIYIASRVLTVLNLRNRG